ncbi:alpha/beta fold hydrolase [Rhizorhabdus histidinilytica]|uniref:Pimeloyl-ACP methyl ester carboxylesterase n=1 Tax=Rhizorhabdus histidinilytica TaxID=439228 RepID=A0A1T5GAR5_9SPHN|nr:alpha/beta hydrolase [Rhizorhabdus histidinilytica]SKC05469.1 Pimeloyl-ACP methyl ester carboxylesterase [Rhizorhabdus histidinilytica]
MHIAGLEQGSVDIGGGTQLYWEAVGTGRPILFVHGLWASSRFFRRQLEAVGRHHRAIALDLRGHGRSSMTPGGHTVPTLAADLRAFIRALGLERPILVGWSMGALIAWEYHLQFGSDDIGGLVVIDQAPTDFRYPGCEDALVGIAEMHDWAAQVLTNRNQFMRAVLPMMFHRQPDDEAADWMSNEMCSAPEAIAAAIFVDQCLRDYRGMIADYDVPTLVCSGDCSAQPRSGAEFLRDRLPRGELRLFADCGHCLFWEDADGFNEALLSFVERLA